MKSNALFMLPWELLAQASQPASQPAAPGEQAASRLWMWLLAAGVCTLAVWIVRRFSHPRKLLLANTPGRPNSINPGHIVVAFVLWLVAQRVAHDLAASMLRLRPVPTAAAAALLALQPLLSFLAPVLAGVRWAVAAVEDWQARVAICTAAAGTAVLACASLVIAALTFRHGIRGGLGLNLRRWLYDSARAVVGYLAVVPLVTALLALGRYLLPSPTHVLIEAARALDGWWLVLTILSAVVLAPLGEELFFRGLMQSMFRRYVRRPWGAIVITSVLFAGLHAPYWDTVGALFALGVVLGYIYERSGRLLPAILLHAIFNGVTLLIAITGW